jgi:hypothetical protein
MSGAAIVLFAAAALYLPKAVEEIANALLGVSVAVSPWVLGFAANRDATTNAIFVGVLVALLAIWAAEFGRNVGQCIRITSSPRRLRGPRSIAGRNDSEGRADSVATSCDQDRRS